GNIDRERFILLLPMFHSFMLCVGVLLPLLSGATVLLISSIQKPRLIIQDILRLRGTILPAIPQFFRALTDPSVPAELPLRLCISGAAPLPVAVLEMFKKKFKFPLLEGYGLSEASPVVSLNPVKGPWKAGSIGLPLPGVEVRITDENVDDLPTGEVGELTVRGGNVMNGYWKRPDEAAKVLKRGWLFTGDMGYKDRDGYIYITGRRKEMLLVNGINVYPREIEEALSEFPGIVETAVVGINDNRRGEQPFAFYVADGGTDLDASTLIEFLRGRLADYKVPRKFRRLDALPRNETGKIQKGRLKEMAGAALD
ncbi:MAG: AMP-binding protein, partial [Verrucomicrobia bacterium]|nr:AMP-binding protein [Verrucomicrobiota bacterium]